MFSSHIHDRTHLSRGVLCATGENGIIFIIKCTCRGNIRYMTFADFRLQNADFYIHRSGHTLDLIIKRDLDGLIQTTPISDSFLSDHCTVISELTLRMPATTKEEIYYRKIKAIDIESFKEDLRESKLCQDPPNVIADLVSCYGSVMTSLLDKHASLQKKTITVRPRVPWFNNEIKEAKRVRRRYERIWRRTGLESHRVNFTRARNHMNHVMEQARHDYYFNLINGTIVIKESFSRRPVHC